MKYRELRKKYRDAGWALLRQGGTSHGVWGKGMKREVIAGKDGADVPKPLLRKLLKRLQEP